MTLGKIALKFVFPSSFFSDIAVRTPTEREKRSIKVARSRYASSLVPGMSKNSCAGVSRRRATTKMTIALIIPQGHAMC